MPVHKFKPELLFEGPTFEPEVTRIMGEAYDLACRALHDKGQPDLVRETIAERIISLASRGEHDPHKLSQITLQSLGIKPRS